MKRRLGMGVVLVWTVAWSAVAAQSETSVAPPGTGMLSPEDAARILARSPGLSNRTPHAQESTDAPTSTVVASSATAGPYGEFKSSPPRPLSAGYPVARLPRSHAAPRRSTKPVKSTPRDPPPNDASQR